MNWQEALKTFGPVAVKILGRPVKDRAATYAADYLNRRREQRQGGSVAVPPTAPTAPAQPGNRLFLLGGLAGLVGLALGVAAGFWLGMRK